MAVPLEAGPSRRDAAVQNSIDADTNEVVDSTLAQVVRALVSCFWSFPFCDLWRRCAGQGRLSERLLPGMSPPTEAGVGSTILPPSTRIVLHVRAISLSSALRYLGTYYP